MSGNRPEGNAHTSVVLRRMTAAAVLDALRAAQAMTATDLMTATGLSRSTVHDVCNELITSGWVRELHDPRRATVGPGRRARCYELNASFGHVVGIDMGARSVTMRLADLRGDAVAETRQVFGDGLVPARERLSEVRRTVKKLLRSSTTASTGVLSVAMGVPTSVGRDGRMHGGGEFFSELPTVDLRAEVARWRRWSVLVENDANLAALAERWRGVAAGVDDVIVILAADQLGSGVFIDGRAVRGHDGGAGQLEFVKTLQQVGTTDGVACLARKWGAEAVAAARRGGRPRAGSLVALAHGDPERVRAETVFQAAKEKDPLAREVVDRVGARLARVVAAVSSFLDPELVVVSAGAAAGDTLLDSVRRALTPDLIEHAPRLAASALGEDAVVIGAVRLALNDVEQRLVLGPRFS